MEDRIISVEKKIDKLENTVNRSSQNIESILTILEGNKKFDPNDKGLVTKTNTLWDNHVAGIARGDDKTWLKLLMWVNRIDAIMWIFSTVGVVSLLDFIMRIWPWITMGISKVLAF